jgi:2-iminobutanoate/2-iminopropanoate deaminase
MKHIFTANAPKPGSYSQGVLVGLKEGETIYISGQVGKTQSGDVVDGEYKQTKAALENILAIIREAGGDADSLVKLDVFLKDEGTPEGRKASREHFNKSYTEFFSEKGIPPDKLPARVMVWVSEIPLEFPQENTLIEISAIAVIPKR